MEELIEAITNLYARVPLDDFPWAIPDDVPICIPDGSSLEKHIYLKENLHPLLQDETDLTHHYWLIQKWGKIGNFKQNEKNNQCLRDLPAQLMQGELQKTLFDVISSLSKVAAFKDPAQYSIYDSRAVLTLNWLLFRHTRDRNLFPIPAGRGKTATNYDTPTLYELSAANSLMRDRTTAYGEYCSLLLDLSREALGKQQPYHLEMLLFVAADEWMRNELTNSVEVIIPLDFD